MNPAARTPPPGEPADLRGLERDGRGVRRVRRPRRPTPPVTMTAGFGHGLVDGVRVDGALGGGLTSTRQPGAGELSVRHRAAGRRDARHGRSRPGLDLECA
jgi:hypothetical protein